MRLPLSLRSVLAVHLIFVTASAAAEPGGAPPAVEERVAPVLRGAESQPAAAMAHTPPLWLLPPSERPARRESEVDGHRPFEVLHPTQTGVVRDGALQPPSLAPALTAGITLSSNFLGVGRGLGGYFVSSEPPDTNGAVGPHHYVQTVNSSFAIFDKKSGAVLYGPQDLQALFRGLGGNCEQDNDGDPVVMYDQFADRWIISQFAVTDPLTGNFAKTFFQCVAVSRTGDPTGAYATYAFQYTYFNDYGKMAVWPDGYYVTFNLFTARRNVDTQGGMVCAYDRTKMIAGLPATQQCFGVGQAYSGLLASSADGRTPPKTGAPNQVLSLGLTGDLLSWKFHADWAQPANSSLSGPVSVPAAGYERACWSECVDQKGGVLLDALGDRLMNRLAYRNFGDHESMVVTHSVNVVDGTSHVGVRWYELRLDGSGNPSVFQQGTFAPDSTHRWFGSAALDRVGNLALGYSSSSAATTPALKLTGRLAADAAGQLTLGETLLVQGNGAEQTKPGRWGDYASMNVDPNDDCTFFFTSEYQGINGDFAWSTRTGAFTLPGCPAVALSPDYSLQLAPASATVARNQTTHYAVSGVAVTGTAGTQTAVTLSMPGLPPWLTATFTPATLTPGQTTADLALTSSAASPAGPYQLSTAGTSGSGLWRVAPGVLVVTGSDFAVSMTPASGKLQAGTVAYAVKSIVVSGTAEAITLAVSGLPAGVTGSFSPASLTGAGQSTLTLTAPQSTPRFKGSIVVTGTSPTVTRTTTAELVIPNDWDLPKGFSATVTQGQEAHVDLKTVFLSGDAESIALSVMGLPVGVAGKFSPAAAAAGQAASLVLTARSDAVAGTYTFSLVGASATQSHQASATVNVVSPGGCGSVSGTAAGALLGLLGLLRARSGSRRRREADRR